jgi:hypothetical protein
MSIPPAPPDIIRTAPIDSPRRVCRVKVLPDQDYIQVSMNMNWFKRIKALKEAAFWKVVAVYLYARNSLNDLIAWLQKR